MQSILPEQRLLEDSAKQEAVLAYLPDPNMRDRLRNRWSHLPEVGQDVSVARWQQLEREADKVGKLYASADGVTVASGAQHLSCCRLTAPDVQCSQVAAAAPVQGRTARLVLANPAFAARSQRHSTLDLDS